MNPNYPTGDPARPPNNPAEPDSNRIDLTMPLIDYSGNWCVDVMNDCSKISVRTYIPGLYYRLRRDATGFLDPSQAASYLEFDINASQGPLRGPPHVPAGLPRPTPPGERLELAARAPH